MSALVHAAGLAAFLAAARGLKRLDEVEPVEPAGGWPRLSCVMPARDEAAAVEGAVRSWLAAYPEVEVVAVNDRSVDETGAILDRLAEGDPRVRAIHLDACPADWLGKTWAVKRALEVASGEWVLLADADVHLAPRALERAVRHAVDHELDLLTALPAVDAAGLVVDAAILGMGPAFVVGSRFAEARRADTERGMGIGAFLLMKRAALHDLEWLKLEVADDVAYGALVKRGGGRVDAVVAGRQVHLVWYASYRDMVAKMQKNHYAILGRFSALRTAGIALAMLVVSCGWLAVLLAPTPLRLGLAALTPALQIGGALVFARWARWPWRGALLAPLGLGLQAASVAWAALQGARLGGVEWRGTRYPRALLKAHQRVRW